MQCCSIHNCPARFDLALKPHKASQAREHILDHNVGMMHKSIGLRAGRQAQNKPVCGLEALARVKNFAVKALQHCRYMAPV